jgi:hypothetical protein
MLCGQIISGSCLFFTEIAFCISLLDHTHIILQSYSKVPVHIGLWEMKLQNNIEYLLVQHINNLGDAPISVVLGMRVQKKNSRLS